MPAGITGDEQTIGRGLIIAQNCIKNNGAAMTREISKDRNTIARLAVLHRDHSRIVNVSTDCNCPALVVLLHQAGGVIDG
jgi:hypothetical protein